MMGNLGETKGIRAMMIIEVIGKPPEHLVETVENIIKKIDEEKGINIVEKTVYEPKKLEIKQENAQELFTTFAEIEAEFDNLEAIIMLVFNYMPSNLEIISPESFILKNDYLSEIMTGIVIRLHKYDEIAKQTLMDKEILMKKVKELMEKEKS